MNESGCVECKTKLWANGRCPGCQQKWQQAQQNSLANQAIANAGQQGAVQSLSQLQQQALAMGGPTPEMYLDTIAQLRERVKELEAVAVSYREANQRQLAIIDDLKTHDVRLVGEKADRLREDTARKREECGRLEAQCTDLRTDNRYLAECRNAQISIMAAKDREILRLTRELRGKR